MRWARTASFQNESTKLTTFRCGWSRPFLFLGPKRVRIGLRHLSDWLTIVWLKSVLIRLNILMLSCRRNGTEPPREMQTLTVIANGPHYVHRTKRTGFKADDDNGTVKQVCFWIHAVGTSAAPSSPPLPSPTPAWNVAWDCPSPWFPAYNLWPTLSSFLWRNPVLFNHEKFWRFVNLMWDCLLI